MTALPDINTVLTIDDEPVDQLLYRRIIERSGIAKHVMPFELAEEALSYLRTEDRLDIDLVLLDINMPRMSGLEFLEQATDEFGENFSQIMVIMLSTSLDPEDERKAREYPAVRGYLKKPLTLEKFISQWQAVHQS
ncbi:MAG: response regulator [Granulosicoccus sp.]|nr:response regulator [Granulosicoccus sp.]